MKRPLRFSLFLTACAATIAVGTAATAQSKRHDKKTKPESENPYAEPESSASPAKGVEAGAPTAPPVETPAANGDAGTKISPLTPPAAEFASADAGPPIDYDRIISDLAALRARSAIIAANLFKSRIVVNVSAESDHAKVSRLVLSLDDGVVYTGTSAPTRGESAPLLSRALAPGKHAVTIEVERKDDRNDAFKTSQRSRFVVDVPRDEELRLDVKLVDASSMGGDFPSDKSGKYDLRIQMNAASRPVKK